MVEHLEPALLRTFLEALAAGGVMRAAPRVGRTRSAVSLQMRRLRQTVGRPLFRKVGRKLELTAAGEALAGWARRLIALNDEALAALRGQDAPELLRLGAPQDVMEGWLPRVLARFTATRPAVRLELMVDHGRVLSEAWRGGRLDLCVRFAAGRDADRAAGGAPIELFAARSFRWNPGEPLPLVVLESPCLFRGILLQALDAAAIPWRIAVSSPGVSAMWAAVRAGLGVTARVAFAVPPGARRWQTPGLGPLPRATLTVDGGETRGDASRALRAEIEREVGAQLRRAAPRGAPGTTARNGGTARRRPRGRPRRARPAGGA
jgi:DNA-binding transcriptional LysR family regulator